MTVRIYLVLSMFLIATSCVLTSAAHGQSVKDQVGFTELLAEKGAALETGAGVIVMQAEAAVGGNYLPNTALLQFENKTIVDGTGTSSDVSNHATGVSANFFGNFVSMSPGVTTITCFEANDYLGRVLNFNTGGDPLAGGFDVGNHSYIGNGLTSAEKINLLQRFDFVINRDNTVMTVGANNGSGNTTPDLLATSYNAITVGRTDGSHSRGPTSDYGSGRFKPDIVAPANFTSTSTPIVGSAVNLLREAATGTNAIRNEVIKSTLFAGATKGEFSDWDRTTTRPIDDVFGFGELNVLNSYHIFEGGEFDAAASDPSTNVGLRGWDLGSHNGTDDQYYDFEIFAGQRAVELSAALVWNVEVTDNNASSAVFDAVSSLANLDLELYDSTGGFLDTLVDASLSTDYNLEHIYLKDLTEGNYTFRISGTSAAEYGFSWQISAVPEPGSVLCLSFGMLGLALRRRRSGLNKAS